MLRRSILVAPLAFVLLSTAAMAGPAEDLARSRIQNIAAGDLAKVAADYGAGATLHWVGGPLDGTYSDPEAIKAVWSKFFTAQGSQKPTVAAVSEAANPKGATVTADVAFAGKATVKVRYVLVYRDGKLVDEVWQVNPAAAY
ncbi:nuclear transport factor 2 family protein [Xanthobacter autotrophicus]|uniref:nuclear transport factor 2 family protein n=1 Tax=Xanthobacter TaxID=279 RepID=UPI0024AB9F53|nr:nuclear transport factor 2 family protein [Xanthobacter autotrophicus]MDI4663482.1 nuclear transport factor 2 family protein [Xanthobacter autotrophicus]